MPPTTPTELTDLDVDRVDAVDRPATRRKFLIVKDESGDKPAGDPVAEAKRLLSAASAALSKVHAHKAEYDDQGIVDALNELAIASGHEGRFAKSVAAASTSAAPEAPAVPPAAVPAVPATAAAAAPPVAAPAPAAIDMEALATAVGTAVVKALKADIAKDDAEVGTADAAGSFLATSSQPAEPVAVAKAGPRKMGDGLFSNVVFGR